MDNNIPFRDLGDKLLSLPERGAVTNYELVHLLETSMPNVSNAWTHVVPALAKYAKHEGKRSLLGHDKGETAYRELEEKLYLVILGLYGDNLLSQGANIKECLLTLLRSLVSFKEAYPNWGDAYSAGYRVFVEGKDEISSILDRHQCAVEAKLFKLRKPVKELSRKTLLEKAQDAPISLRILMDSLQNRLERDYHQVLLLRRWDTFSFAGTVAGCVGLALRLHFDVPERERTSIELAMRDVLQKRFPEAEQVYGDCNRFLTESLAEIPRAERGKHLFVLLGLWVFATVADGETVEKEEWIVGQIAEMLQNETIGFWKQPYPSYSDA